jgi:sugar lactone lactonase YvrE
MSLAMPDLERGKMREFEIEIMIDFPLALGESPVWDDGEGVLWFVDITERLVLRLDPASRHVERFEMPAPVASLGLAAGGKLVLALRSGVHLFDPASGKLEFLVHPEPEPHSNRLNDGKVGPDGNFWIGSMDDRPKRDAVGALYRVAPDGSSSRIVDGLFVSNGLAWSPDGSTMYHADTRGSYVQVFDFDPAKGEATNRRTLLRLDEAQGLPDGAAVDRDGFYWSAGITAGIINRISPQGEIVERIPLPLSAPTMPCFGGVDRKTLFVTSLASARSGQQQSGTLIAFRVAVPGLASSRFGEPFGAASKR